MLSLKSISETLAVLGGVALIGCGSSQAPVNATEVEDPKPAGGEVTEMKGDEAAGATTAAVDTPAPEPTATAEATAAPTTTAVAAAPTATAASTAKPAATTKPAGTAKGGTAKKKKDGAEAKCGEGSCG